MRHVTILLFFVSSFVFSQNYLTLLDTDVFRGNSYDIPIDLINNDPIRAIQYDINIPEGFIFDIDNVTQTPILNDFTTLISSLGNNNYRFIIYTIGNDIISSGNQTILTLPIFVENSIDLGQYTFQFSNVVLSSETNQNISSDAPSIGYIYVTEDSIAPVITLLGDATVSIEVGDTYIDAGATAKDNYDGDITSNIVTVSNVDTAIVGSYTVTYDVSDANGNAAITVTRTVNVVDTTAPVITLLGDDPVTLEVGDAYTDAGATATDNYDGDITSSIITVSTVNTAIVGVYTVTYNVSDASGNTAVELIRTVNVEDALSLENFEQIKFSLFPNPSTGDITVMYYLPGLMDGVLAEVYDMLGRLVWTQVIEQEQGKQQANLNLNSLQKGNYIVMINAGNNRGEKFVNNKILILK